ncbi:MAG: hypothetical protein DRJ31_01475 [Candidatus Methanomethylicota archaeon]|uniref:Uncharacterized protein n=1 Tax=Thermoproteota archaeon TaxID=2056631 RepID=A0A497ETT5_9CREN|nr:MAG: hypothetical protein DRJ31_01475 [Candidatus Verstraetearchaeota archaeon]
MVIYNYVTKVKGRVALTILPMREYNRRFDWIVEEMKYEDEISSLNLPSNLRKVYRHKARLMHWTIELLTNSKHVYTLWRENWWEAENSSIPDAWVVALVGVQHPDDLQKMSLDSPDPKTFYCRESKVYMIINSEYYGQAKSQACLGLTAELAEEEGGNILPIHGGCVKVFDKGIILIAPTGTGKTTHTYALALWGKPGETAIHSDDWVFVDLKTYKVYPSERKFYLRTNIVDAFPEFTDKILNSLLENADPSDLAKDMVARCVIDPVEMLGEDRVVREVAADAVWLFKRDYWDPHVVVKLSPTKAIEVLEDGRVYRYAYKRRNASGVPALIEKINEPYYNPYLIDLSEAKQPIRRMMYFKLFKKAQPYWVNTRLSIDQMQRILRKLALGEIDKAVVEGEEVILYKDKSVVGREVAEPA